VRYAQSASVSKAQIARAKEVAVLDYLLAHEPDNLKKCGNEYRLRDHDSFTISNGMWHWHSRGFGCKTATALNYLIEVRGYGFVEAVQHLAGDDTRDMARDNFHNNHRYRSKAPCPKPNPPSDVKMADRLPFVMPPRNNSNDRVIEYLQSRGINKDLILECIERGSLYENARYHNCIFVGRDERGKARFAAMRGTNSDFKCDANGSDKRFGFVLPPDFGKTNHSVNSRTLMIFESPIDALSHKTLHPETNGWRLSLGCTALAAMMQFLEMQPDISHIIACTDNDEAGNTAAAKIEELLTTAELSHISYARAIPNIGKDWSENLQSIRNEVKPLEDVRKDIRFMNSNYNEMFTIKDGDSIKITRGFDGGKVIRKCRFIDETHLNIGTTPYHLYEFAERMEQSGNRYEAVPKRVNKIDILSAKYGEALQDVAIPMTEAAIRKLVGGDYELTPLTYSNDKVYAMRADGPDGVAICGIADEILTSLHPYSAQSCKLELSPAERPTQAAPTKKTPTQDSPAKKPSLLGQLDKAKSEVAQQNAANAVTVGKKTAGRSSTEIG